MDKTQPDSVFDIIGPVMVGPSSSHTAGAVRIGRIARAMLGCPPAQALIELHGSFALTGRGHGTDKALVAGLLGMEPSDENIPHSFDLAEKAGLAYTIVDTDLGDEAHPNSVRITIQGENRQLEMIGASVGGGMIEVTELQGYSVNFSGELDTLIVIAEDQPGTINTVTGWLMNQNINVAFLKVGRQQRGGEAIMIIETDQPIPSPLVKSISEFDWVRWVRRVRKLGE